ncbi:uncharacterized protein M421DRAFT_187199 [Didymella exigua CBS 183.55]|uniref:Uncharacterized protein n=1 Tax=Didymella exigua CBS 183.55 TaxID=1150837 RepID=A0A6A5RKM1_9PLEO|nr:uncharacterized protein M421DRAFT_187199 [Didymella exigua CBS 183.55]KAF1926936.1 hypothetical protein M421DRAFT_187199 [Didymella exigua CBS 183.55]
MLPTENPVKITISPSRLQKQPNQCRSCFCTSVFDFRRKFSSPPPPKSSPKIPPPLPPKGPPGPPPIPAMLLFFTETPPLKLLRFSRSACLLTSMSSSDSLLDPEPMIVVVCSIKCVHSRQERSFSEMSRPATSTRRPILGDGRGDVNGMLYSRLMIVACVVDIW